MLNKNQTQDPGEKPGADDRRENEYKEVPPSEGRGEVQEVEEDRCQRGVGGRQVEGVKMRMTGIGRRRGTVMLEWERKRNMQQR